MEKKAYVYDEPLTSETFLPFALTDYFIQWTQENKQPLLHFWQLDQTFILGMKDLRVTDLKAGLIQLAATPYTPMVRSAGGLGVINDEGVLNISLFLPNSKKNISIDEAYEIMTSLMQKAFSTPEFPIEAYEIPRSYCPGKFDLSIHGKKIAGIAQRRLKEGIAVMLYLSVEGSQSQRGEAVKNFYQASLKENFGKLGYPPVEPDIMANLSDFYPITMLEVKTRFTKVFADFKQAEVDTQLLKETLQEKEVQIFLTEKYQKMQDRNEDLQNLLQEVSHDNFI